MDNRRLFDLLSGTARRDEAAFSQLYREFYPTVRGIALSVTGDEADSNDAAQEVFALLWTLPPQRFPRENPGAWLYTVTRRKALALRQGRPTLPLEELPPLPAPSDLEDPSFQELVAPLDEESRQIVTLKVKAGYTHREIAQLLHKNPATVRWKYAKALHGLRLFWAELLGALVLGFFGVRALLPQVPTAGGPSEGGLSEGGPALEPGPFPDWLPGLLFCLLGALLLAGAAALLARSLWKRRKK